MDYRLAVYSLLHIPALLMVLLAALPAWSHRDVPGVKYVALLGIVAGVWVVGAGFEMAAAAVPLSPPEAGFGGSGEDRYNIHNWR